MGRLSWASKFVAAVASLRRAGIFLATSFTFLAEHVSISIYREVRYLNVQQLSALHRIWELNATGRPLFCFEYFACYWKTGEQLREQGLFISTREVGRTMGT